MARLPLQECSKSKVTESVGQFVGGNTTANLIGLHGVRKVNLVTADQLDLTIRNAPDERGDGKSRFSRIAV